MTRIVLISILIMNMSFANDNKLLKNIAFYKQSEALGLRCEKQKYSPRYSTSNDYLNAKKSIAATLQYIGLQITAKAIVDHIKLLEYTDSEAEKLYDNLVQNDCSKNITSMSLRKIRSLFDKDNNKNDLPKINSIVSFKSSVKNMLENKMTRINEFKNTIENFRSFCSWSNIDNDFGLIAPFLANRFVMNMLIDHFTKKEPRWNSFYNETRLYPKKDTVRVSCKGLLCRKKDDLSFKKDFPRMLGSLNIKDDLENIYCHDFINLVLQNNKSKKLNKIVKSKDEAQVFSEVMNYVSLITKTPDILNAVDNSKDLLSLYNENVLSFWDKWAKNEIKSSSKKLLYEEALNVDLISNRETVNALEGNFNLKFRYTLGEYDRMFKDLDKIDLSFNLIFKNKYLSWYRRRYISLYNKSDYVGIKNLKEDFEKRIDLKLQNKGRFFLTNLWNKKMAKIVMDDLSGQVLDFQGSLQESGDKIIPIQLEFGVFALKFIRKKYEANFIKNSIVQKN